MPRVVRAADKAKTDFAREQRQQPTEGEQILWRSLRGGKLGVKFRRQHPVGDFVLDFYSEQAHLAVEIDGDVHADQRTYDEWRDEQLARQGIRVLRVAVREVFRDRAAVLNAIKALIEA